MRRERDGFEGDPPIRAPEWTRFDALSLSPPSPLPVQGFAGNSAGAPLTGARNVARSRDPVVSRDVYCTMLGTDA